MRMKMKSSERNNQTGVFLINPLQDVAGGVALILVVWVMIILVAIVGEFSYSMRTEINITRNFKEEAQTYQLALAGIESAKFEILSAEKPADIYVNENGILLFNQDEEEPERKDELGNGTLKYDIVDEEGKLNINKASQDQLEYIFLDSGVDFTEVDEIVDSIIDWRDSNDLHMLNGAEEEYYRSLPEPYSCKDGPFDSVEELLLVKGMTPEIFYGSAGSSRGEEDSEEEEAYDGVAQYLTVNGPGMININTAGRVVLEAALGVEKADNIILQREAGPIATPVKGGKVSSTFFTVTSTGANADGTIVRSVRTIMQKKENSLEPVYWNDNIIG
jgi:general secretion pathway protein K